MTYTLAPDVTATGTADGVVLLDQKRGRYFQLNRNGSAVLRSLLAGDSVADAAARLREQHQENGDRVARDAERLVDQLVAAKLVIP